MSSSSCPCIPAHKIHSDDDWPCSTCPFFIGNISVFNSVSSTFYAPSNLCGKEGMRREYIWACPNWQNEGPHQDCIFVVTNLDSAGFLGLDVVQVLSFFSFSFQGCQYPCAVICWFDCVDNAPSDNTSMWVVKPSVTAVRQPKFTVIHINSIFCAAHLIPVFLAAPQLLPEGIHPHCSYDHFCLFYINKFTDYHAFATAFWLPLSPFLTRWSYLTVHCDGMHLPWMPPSIYMINCPILAMHDPVSTSHSSPYTSTSTLNTSHLHIQYSVSPNILVYPLKFLNWCYGPTPGTTHLTDLFNFSLFVLSNLSDFKPWGDPLWELTYLMPLYIFTNTCLPHGKLYLTKPNFILDSSFCAVHGYSATHMRITHVILLFHSATTMQLHHAFNLHYACPRQYW